MSFLEWIGLSFIMVGLFVGLLYAFKFTYNKKSNIENSYNNNDQSIDDDEY